MNKTAFVTGGTGFVGSHLVDQLLGRGYHVRCLVRAKPRWIEGLNVELVRGDLSEIGVLREAVRDVDTVFHVAGVTRAPKAETFYEANVAGTLRLAEALSEAGDSPPRFVVTSSLAVVGRSDAVVAHEDTPLDPISDYGKSKLVMERQLADAWGALPITVLRPPAVFGPRESDILSFFKTVNRGFVPLVGSGSAPNLSLVYVRDLVRGMVDAAESDRTIGETYYLGSDEVYTWRDVGTAVANALGRKRAIKFAVPTPLFSAIASMTEGVGRLVGRFPALTREKAEEILHGCKACSVDKAKAHFGYRQQVPLSVGIAETAAWYRERGWL